MRVIYGIRQLRRFKKPVVALGVFDGVHRGHRFIITRMVKKARTCGGTSVVVTFWPDPGRELSLYSLEHRLRLLQELGVAVCIVIGFSKAFAAMSPEDFVSKILCSAIGARFIYVGKNFRFGRRARGTCQTLRSLAEECGYELTVCRVIRTAQAAVSSTLIRKQIARGRLERAHQLLGRPVSILGTVIRGSAFGRQWGVPTANINPHHEIIPPAGIYAVRVYLGKKGYNGVCYIGRAPRFLRVKPERASTLNIEVHIFEFHGDIYDRNIEIQFLKKIRERIEFSQPADLINQIKKDIKEAARIL